MSAEEKKCLYVEKGRCGKVTESTDLQCLLCVGSGLSYSSINLVRSLSQATVTIEEAAHILDSFERINRFLNGYNKLIQEKYSSKEEYKEMCEAFKNIEETEIGERIKRQLKRGFE
jgi:hypothetical protein